MGSIFNVESSVLVLKAGVLEANAEECRALSSKLLGVYESMGSSYISDDNKKFGEKITELCNNLKTLADQLQNGAEVLKTGSKAYDTREENNFAAASKLP